MILALDLATNSGWAAGDGFHPTRYGSFTVEGSEGSKLLQMGREVRQLIDKIDPKQIVIEMPFKGKLVFGLRAAAVMAAAYKGVPVVDVRPDQYRKHFLGKARWKREVAKREAVRVCKEYGYEPKNDDEAEAIAMLSWRLAKIDPYREKPGMLAGR